MTSPLRIALVTETYVPQVNGVSRTLDRLVRHLAGRGDRVLLITPRYREAAPPLPEGVEQRQIAALPLPCYREVLLPFTRPGHVAALLRDFRPDLVHLATEGPLGWAALKGACRAGLPLVSSYHSNFSQYLHAYRLGRLEPVAWNYLRWFHNRTAVTFCPTPSIRTMLEARDFRRVETWGRGVDSERFHPRHRDESLGRSWGLAADGQALVYVGRLAAEKNLDMLLAAWRLLPDRSRLRLVLVGDGPLRRELEAAGDPGVVFTGYRHGEELARIYASGDLFVFPSLTETFGNVLLEGMASGLPAAAYRVPGPQDVVRHGATGLLADTVDAPSLAGIMAALLADRPLLLRLRQAARAYAETQSWERIFAALRQNYLEALSEWQQREGKIPSPLHR